MALSIDLIVHNGRIYDPSGGFGGHTALAAAGNRIIATGSDREILPAKNHQTRILNAGGRWILPALSDSHTHFLGYVKRKKQVDLSTTRSLREALQIIKEAVQRTPSGGWITGGGWDKNRWGLSDLPTRAALDGISQSHFIALDSKDWHTLWVNSAVLKLTGMDRPAADPEGGHIVRDSRSGQPTGILQEKAREPVFRQIPVPSLADLRVEFQEAMAEFHRLGFGSIHSMEGPDEFRIYQEAYQEGKLQLRISWYLPAALLPQAQALGFHSGFGNNFLQISGIKLFADGALGSQSAYLLENYNGLPHRGIATLDESGLEALVSRAIAARLNCAVHAIGDAANRMVLDVFGKLATLSRRYRLRHRIEHAQLLHPEDIPKFGEFDITASVQPIHLAADIPLIEQYWGKRGRYAYPFRSILEGGGRLIFGSDTPIEDFNPWKAIYTARERRAGVAPRHPSYYPEEKLDMTTALKAYTVNSAWAVGRESRLGRLRPGYLADFFVPDRNIFSEETALLPETRSLLTVMNGQIVHRALD